jgi:uncharacterized 2Fe-2S/4Fe-4S cluster protein (DUF4445 family)
VSAKDGRPRGDDASEAKIVFTPSGKRGRFPLGTPVLTAARQLGVDLDSVCGARGICGRCLVRLSEGEFAAFGLRSESSHLNEVSEPEQRFALRSGLAPGHRLACHAQVRGDLVIDVPASSQVHQQVVRKAHEHRSLRVDPVVHLHTVDVEPACLERPGGDLERLLAALASEWQLTDLRCAPHVLRDLQSTLRAADWRVTAAVRERREVVALWPGFRGRVLGVAVDVGSTTIAAHCCDLTSGEVLASAGAMNPQIRFGEDLMSRVSYAMLNPGGATELCTAVREALDSLVSGLLAQVGADPESLLEVSIVGNPIMHHLLLGLSPSTPEPGRTSCPASRATSAPTPPACCSPNCPSSPTPPRCSSTSVPTPRSCSPEAGASSQPRAPPAPPSRGPRSPAGNALHQERSNASGSTRKPSSPASA